MTPAMSWPSALSAQVLHAGWTLEILLFTEGEQAGWIRDFTFGDYREVILPGYTNLDCHLSRAFEWMRMKFTANASLRNILDSDVELAGLTLRDRRFYLTVGIQY